MRKLQHTLIFAGLVAACLMAGCKKENPSQGTSFTAETEQGEANAKTGLVGSNIVWRSGDQIQLKNSSSPSQTETLTVADDGIGTNKGKFYTSSSFNLNPPYTASYGVNVSNGAVSLPSTQTLTAANVVNPGTIADGVMPMVATSSTNKLPFKNLLGGLCFKLTGSGALTAIRITSNTSEKLWGDFTANFSDGTMAPTGGTGSNVLTVNCTGVTLSNTVQYFIVMLPPGTLASGYTVEFLNGNTVNHSVNAPGSANLVQRSKIKTSNQTVNIVPVVQYTVTTSVNNASGGTVSGGGTYEYGQTCTVTASPYSGYICESWTIGSTVYSYSRSYSFTVTNDVTIRANFIAVPTGAIGGLFSVSASQKVWFSMGNLQYNGNSTWSFASSQWSYLGNTTAQNGYAASTRRDLFYWGTSNIDHGTLVYQPWATALYANYGGWYNNVCKSHGNQSENLYTTSDWGYNAITNGGNTQNSGWRTLSNSEWNYLLNSRPNAADLRGLGTVNSVYGLIILPDNCPHAISAGWATLEADGAVFLPASGCVGFLPDDYRKDYNHNPPIYVGFNDYIVDKSVSPDYMGLGTIGYYWSATTGGNHFCYCLLFDSDGIRASCYDMIRIDRLSVRLVKNR